MDFRKIKALIEVVTEKDIAELEVESSEGKIRIRRNTTRGPAEQGPPPYIVVSSSALPPPAAAATPALESSAPALPGAGAASAAASQPAKTEEEEDIVVVTAPIVGTFYEASSPDAPPFVEVGDTVKAGQVLCIIEAMKLMNEIEAEIAGVIEKKFVSNAQPVEFGEALFAIKPNK